MRLNHKWLIKLVGIIIFIVLLVKIDLKKAVQILSDADLLLLLLSFALSFIIFIIRTFRWGAILKLQGHAYRFKELFKSNLGGLYFASVTPGQVGELIKIYYLNQHRNIPAGTALSSIVLDRFMNIPILLVIALIGTFFFPVGKDIQIFLAVFFAVFLLGLVFLVMSKGVAKRLCRRLLRLGFLKKKKEKLKSYFKEFYSGVHSMLSLRAGIPVGISLFGLVIVFLQAYVLASALSISISLLHLCIAVSMSMVIALVPISFVGIGTRDMALVLLFGSIGLSAESAISFSFLFLLTNYVFVAVVGAYYWFRHPLDPESIKGKK